MRSGSMPGKYYGTFKEFTVEELLQDPLPVYFIYTEIE
jgi:hypothetical protein